MADEVETKAGTRERLLSAAEGLLLSEEYDEVSVRGICAAAGANPAAVHYHFGSKDALVTALLEDRLEPLWADRLGAAAEYGSVGAVVDAILGPFVELSADPLGQLHLRLLAKFVLGRHPMAFDQHWFRLGSWVGLLPDLGARESRRRWIVAFDLIILRFGGGGLEPEVARAAVATLRDFVIAGLTAPTGQQR
ncbi:TetR/AcrR family transcriptional regulator [Nocardia callitridis]